MSLLQRKLLGFWIFLAPILIAVAVSRTMEVHEARGEVLGDRAFIEALATWIGAAVSILGAMLIPWRAIRDERASAASRTVARGRAAVHVPHGSAGGAAGSTS